MLFWVLLVIGLIFGWNPWVLVALFFLWLLSASTP